MAYRYVTTLVVLCLSGCATAPETTPFVDYPPVSEAGHLADVAITAAAVSSGAAEEANPIVTGLGLSSGAGWAVGTALKLGFVWWSRTLPPEHCRPAYSVVGGMGWGATVANAVTLTLSPPLWAAIMVGTGAGIGIGVLTYDHVAEDACRREDMSVFSQ